MDDISFDEIKKNRFFQGLAEKDIAELISACKEVSFMEDDYVFRQHEESDSLYIITSGVISILDEANQNKVIAVISKNQVLGEMGVISGEERLFSAKAITSVDALKISKVQFVEYFVKRASSTFEWLKVITQRHSKSFQGGGKREHKAMVSLVFSQSNSQLGTYFKFHLSQAIEKVESTIVLDLDVWYVKYSSNLEIMIEQFNRLEAKYDYIFLFCHSNLKFYQYILANRLSHIGVLVDSKNFKKHKVMGLISKLALFSDVPMSVLLHCDQGDDKNIDFSWFDKPHHVVKIAATNRDDYLRVARTLTGNAVGLVLGGGGENAIFHLGVLKALKERSIPIDAIAGASSGGVLAAAYTVLDEMDRLTDLAFEAYDLIVKSTKLGNINFIPYISLYSNKKIVDKVKEVFKSTRFEELSLPLYIIVFDFNRRIEKLWNQGLLWKSVVATISIPGIFPPFLDDGELYIDGGIVNNLPVNTIKQAAGEDLFVIASDVSAAHDVYAKYHFPTKATSLKILLSKLPFVKKSTYQYPGIFKILIDSLLCHNKEKQRDNLDLADMPVLLCTDHNCVTAEEMMQYGYKQTLASLDKKNRRDTRFD